MLFLIPGPAVLGCLPYSKTPRIATIMQSGVLGFSVLLAIICAGTQAAAAEAAAPASAVMPVVAAPPSLPPAATFGGSDAYGLPPALPAADFFPILPFDADDNAEPQLLPLASNHALDGDLSTIARAVIVIHDTPRDANGAVSMLAALAGPANNAVLILAPQFLLASDIARFKGHLPDAGRTLASWPLDSWEAGGESAAPAPQRGISSYTVVDLLLLYLADKKNFPALKDITVAGHGAGGDFVLRYAALGQAPDLLEKQHMPVRFLAANASSYLYFTAMRPLQSKPGFVLPDAKACPDHNNYPYGLGHLNAYGLRSGGDAIRLRYPYRRVTVLAGKNAADPFPDGSCAAKLEGASRFARAANYEIYINTIFGGDAAKAQNFNSIPGAGYDAVEMFDSACGMSVLFGDGVCAPDTATSPENSQ
jgi:hypothetical protein